MDNNKSFNKKVKRFCSFNDKWLIEDQFKSWLIKVDEENAKCCLCESKFSIKHKGIGDVNKHMQSDKHKDIIKARNQNEIINQFLITKETKEENQIIAAEIAFVYHSVMHHHSYLSLDCGNNLNRIIFNDSKIAKKISCGRTKAAAISSNVLSPNSIERHLKYLIDNKIKFSISTDASNKGNTKMYPIAIQYFHSDDGIVNFILDFYETPNETSYSIYHEIKERLSKNKLLIENVVAFGADNASVNYGIHNSVYVNLKNENIAIVKANCLCHVIHNTAKYAFVKFPIDIENLVIKMYSHFSTSSKRIDSLKQFYQYTDNEYEKIIKHTPTRWLTLNQALERLIHNLDQIKSYFFGIKQDEIPNIIYDLVWDFNEESISLNELYLRFAYEFTKLLNNSILMLEKKPQHQLWSIQL